MGDTWRLLFTTQWKAGRWPRLLTSSHQVTRPGKKKKFGELLWTLDVAACFSPKLVDDKQRFFIIPLPGFACELQRSPVLMKTSSLIYESVYFDHASFQLCDSLQTSVASLRSANEDQRLNLRACLNTMPQYQFCESPQTSVTSLPEVQMKCSLIQVWAGETA